MKQIEALYGGAIQSSSFKSANWLSGAKAKNVVKCFLPKAII